ncbi:hypothetical protein IRZ71_01375 [Flavobacterium sp. ANB]|uniref:DUF6252 family protein n=1 Tax=unclassified Flavobacterium TaxID=196869 RepID=UPI0012BA25A6|nr:MULTISPECIES: DUF6252 family protein [unclassified Flavobacterium]MBF4514973.1 hypothetical protein [Flavobacterium sp. ANB]MTD68299.1 hypothetical protein [Flavobacterium sp. LC2016-13]
MLSVLISSCASDSDTDNDKQKAEYNINFNNTPLLFPDLKATRDGDYFFIGESDDFPPTPRPEQIATDFTLYFHKDGTLFTAGIHDNSSKNGLSSPFYFSKNLFKFNIENIDETNKKIKVNFSGNVYEHYGSQIYQYNKKLDGSISISYSEKGEVNSYKTNGTTMKINGQNWRGLGYEESEGYSKNGRIIKINGDNEYSIAIFFPNSIPKKGKYVFTKNLEMDALYTVNFYKYYPNTIGPDDYSTGPEQFITTGVLEITDLKGSNIIGTFSFTAVNPTTNESIVVTNGVFTERLL